MIKEGLFSHSKIDEDLKADVSSAKVEEIIRGFALGRGSSFDDVDLEQIRLDHSIGLYRKVETREFLTVLSKVGLQTKTWSTFSFGPATVHTRQSSTGSIWRVVGSGEMDLRLVGCSVFGITIAIYKSSWASPWRH